MVSRNHVPNNEKPQKIIDFVDSGYFTAFCVISRKKVRENANLKKREIPLLFKIKKKSYLKE